MAHLRCDPLQVGSRPLKNRQRYDFRNFVGMEFLNAIFQHRKVIQIGFNHQLPLVLLMHLALPLIERMDRHETDAGSEMFVDKSMGDRFGFGLGSRSHKNNAIAGWSGFSQHGQRWRSIAGMSLSLNGLALQIQ